MRVHRTYDGRSFEIKQPLSHFQSKEDFFDAVSLTTGIPSDDIICMAKTGQQVNEDVLEEMQEGMDGNSSELVSGRGMRPARQAACSPSSVFQEFFVFHRQFLYADLDMLVDELEEVAELQPHLEEAEVTHPPTPRSLASLVDWCALILSNMTLHSARSSDRLDQLSVIQRSTSIALSNLLSHSSSVRESAGAMESTAAKELTRMSGLLLGHETDLKILCLVHINPKLLSVPDPAKAKPKERTLGDYVSPSKMGAVYQACSSVQSELDESLRGLKINESQLNEDTEGLKREVQGTSISPSQETCEESRQALERAKQVHDFIMATCLPDDQGWSAAARLAKDDAMMKRVDEAMGELILLDEVVRESLRRLTADKNDMVSRSLHLLGDISSLQSDYADLGIEINQLDAEFKSNRIDGFRHLARLKNMLWAYGSTLIEIHRRREFESKFLIRSQALAEVMANLSESERTRRVEFRSQVVGALPWEVKGMDGNTPSLEISAGKGRGEEEIDIGRADVDELFRTLDFVEATLLEQSTTTPIEEVKVALQQLVAKLDEAEVEFVKLVEVGLLDKPEEDTDSDDEAADRFTRQRGNGFGSRVEKEKLEKEVQELKLHQGERERAMAEGYDRDVLGLRAEISKLKMENRQLEHTAEQERTQHEETRKTLESRVADAEVEAARRINMEDEVSRLRKDVEDARRAEMESKVEASEEVERANDLEAHLSELQVDLEEAKDARNDACSRIEALLSKDNSAEKQLSLAQERIDELSNQVSQARIEERKARDALYEIETARDKLLRNYRAEADGDRAILEETLRSQNVELEEARERTRRHERELGEHLDSVKNLQGQLTAADVAHEELVLQLESSREATMNAEMSKRQTNRNLEAIMEKARPLLAKLVELHNTLRDMPPLSTSSSKASGTKAGKELVPAGDALDVNLEGHKQRAIDKFQAEGDSAGTESILELINWLSRAAMLDSTISKLESLPILCKKWIKAYKHINEKSQKQLSSLRERITFRHFAIGDLALFLPTRNNSGRPWAAFNINFPHYFLNFSGSRENEQLKESLQNKEWIVARITRIENRVASAANNTTEGDSVQGNPFQLAEGVKFFLLDVEGWNHANSTAANTPRRKSTSTALTSTGASAPALKRWDTSPDPAPGAVKASPGTPNGTVAQEVGEEDMEDEDVRPANPAAPLNMLSTSSPVTTTTMRPADVLTLSRASSPSGIAISLRNRSTSPEMPRGATRSAHDIVEAGFTRWPLVHERQGLQLGSGNGTPALSSAKSEAGGETHRKGMEGAKPAFGRSKNVALSSASGGYGTAMLHSRSTGGPLSPPLAQAKASQQMMPIHVADRSSAAHAGRAMDSSPNPFSASPAATSGGIEEMREYFTQKRRVSSRLRPSEDDGQLDSLGSFGKAADKGNREGAEPRNRISSFASTSTTTSPFRPVSMLGSSRVHAVAILSPSTEVAQGLNSFGHQVAPDEARIVSSTSIGSQDSSSTGFSAPSTLPRNSSSRRQASSSSWGVNWTLGRKAGSKAMEAEVTRGPGFEQEGPSSSASQHLRRLADGKAQ